MKKASKLLSSSDYGPNPPTTNHNNNNNNNNNRNKKREYVENNATTTNTILSSTSTIVNEKHTKKPKLSSSTVVPQPVPDLRNSSSLSLFSSNTPNNNNDAIKSNNEGLQLLFSMNNNIEKLIQRMEERDKQMEKRDKKRDKRDKQRDKQMEERDKQRDKQLEQSFTQINTALQTIISSVRIATISDWDKPVFRNIKLSANFQNVINDIQLLFSAANIQCFYWVQDGFTSRYKINNQETYAVFLQNSLPYDTIKLYIYSSEGSPTNSPTVQNITKDEAASGSKSNRSASNQQNFRGALIQRDGEICNLCDSTENVEACHIIPQKSDIKIIKEAGLYTSYDIYNGIMLCKTCHSKFDKGFWYINSDGYAIISNALLKSKKSKKHFRPLNNKKLRVFKEDNPLVVIRRPFPSVLKYHEEICMKKKSRT